MPGHAPEYAREPRRPGRRVTRENRRGVAVERAYHELETPLHARQRQLAACLGRPRPPPELADSHRRPPGAVDQQALGLHDGSLQHGGDPVVDGGEEVGIVHEGPGHRRAAGLPRRDAACEEAGGGCILTNQKTLSTIEDFVEAQPVEKLHLKGMQRPVSAFNILGTKS